MTTELVSLIGPDNHGLYRVDLGVEKASTLVVGCKLHIDGASWPSGKPIDLFEVVHVNKPSDGIAWLVPRSHAKRTTNPKKARIFIRRKMR